MLVRSACRPGRVSRGSPRARMTREDARQSRTRTARDCAIIRGEEVGMHNAELLAVSAFPMLIITVVIVVLVLRRRRDVHPDDDSLTGYWQGFSVRPSGDLQLTDQRWRPEAVAATATFRGSTARNMWPEPTAEYRRVAAPRPPAPVRTDRMPSIWPITPTAPSGRPTPPRPVGVGEAPTVVSPQVRESNDAARLLRDALHQDTREFTLVEVREVFQVTPDASRFTEIEVEQFFRDDPLGSASLPIDLEL